MPKGDWRGKLKAGLIPAVAFGAAIPILSPIAVGLIDQAGYQQYATDQTAQHARYAEQKEGEACRGVPPEQLVHCFSEARIETQLEKRSYEHDQADLVAQRKAALWAEMMGIAALFGIWLSVVGVYLVWITFGATREGNKITERIGQAQTRCYLSVRSVRFRMPTEGVPEIYLCIKNSGNSPARKLTISYSVLYHIWEDGEVWESDWSPQRTAPETYEIPAGDELEIPKFAIEDKFSARVRSAFDSKDSSLGVTVLNHFSWEDVFELKAGMRSRWDTTVTKDVQGAVAVLTPYTITLAEVRAREAREKHEAGNRA